MKKIIRCILLFLGSLLLAVHCKANTAEEESFWQSEEQMQKYMDLEAIDELLSQNDQTSSLSFRELILSLMSGDFSLAGQEFLKKVKGMLLDEIRQQRKAAVQILVIVLSCAVFSNFIRVFGSSQIAEISFYMMYLLISTLLMQSFLSMHSLVSGTCSSIAAFMKVLLPAYLTAVVLCSGSVSALGFYEVTVLGINLIQTLGLRIILPAVNFYLVLRVLNQLSGEDYFSKFAELIEQAAGWTCKTILGVVVGLQTVQCLIAPSVDSLKNSGLHRLVRVVPGIGNVLDAAVETVAGSALVLKNAVGVAGILVLVFLCAAPVLKLAVCILIFRFLCALIQPISDKRMVEGISSISGASALLLRILFSVTGVFIISLAMITAAVHR